ncbi:hypothetical protein ACOME3_002609 [Neoechinorhynchus agilis]
MRYHRSRRYRYGDSPSRPRSRVSSRKRAHRAQSSESSIDGIRRRCGTTGDDTRNRSGRMKRFYGENWGGDGREFRENWCRNDISRGDPINGKCRRQINLIQEEQSCDNERKPSPPRDSRYSGRSSKRTNRRDGNSRKRRRELVAKKQSFPCF